MAAENSPLTLSFLCHDSVASPDQKILNIPFALARDSLTMHHMLGFNRTGCTW